MAQGGDVPVILAGSVDGPGRVELRMSIDHAHALRDLLRWFDPSNAMRPPDKEQRLLADIEEALR